MGSGDSGAADGPVGDIQPYPLDQGCRSCEGLTVFPYHFEQKRFVGGFLCHELPIEARIPDVTGYLDEPPDAVPDVPHRLAGPYLFAGPAWNHFGHILTDSMHRLWPAMDVPDALTYV